MNPVFIKLAFSSSIHISMTYFQVTNFIMPKFVEILEFMTKTDGIVSAVLMRTFFLVCLYIDVYEHFNLSFMLQ